MVDPKGGGSPVECVAADAEALDVGGKGEVKEGGKEAYVILSSSVPVTKAANTPVAETPVASAENGAKKAAVSAPLTYKELKAIATQVKGLN